MIRLGSNGFIGFATLVATCLALFLALPMPGMGADNIATTRAKIDAKRQHENRLSSGIADYNKRIRVLQRKVDVLAAKQAKVQADLDVKVARQQEVVHDLRASRAHLARLRERLRVSQEILARRLVAIYKAGQPDIISVALSSHGFAELVERTEYVHRIAVEDHRVIMAVTTLRGETRRQTAQLSDLEAEASQLVAQVRTKRNAVAGAKEQLASRQGSLSETRDSRSATLASVSEDRRALEKHLDSLVAENQSVVNFLGNIPAGPIKHGSGQLIWPVNGAFTSPFGMRWGRLHAGVDLAAPSGTPIRAADGGKVVYAGWMGGYGNYTCVQHTASMATCYGHQSSIGVSVGQNVTQGQVIGAVGNTGHSFGAHLHFEVRINGTPVDPMGYL